MEKTGKSVQSHMGATETAIHMVMIAFTFGFWYPVYKSRKNTLERTSTHYA